MNLLRKNIFILSLLLFLVRCNQGRKEPRVEAIDSASTKPDAVPDVIKNPVNTNTKKQPFLTNRLFLNGKVELMVPDVFAAMRAEEVMAKYPTKEPIFFQVYTNAEGSVNIAVEHLQEKGAMADLPNFSKIFGEQFSDPSVHIIRNEIEKINGRDFIVLEMVTPAVDTEVYNLMFVTSSGGRLLMGTFNCPVDKQDEWQPLAEKILGSVKVKD